jgi:hypothetical protein
LRERLTRASIEPAWPAAEFELFADAEQIMISHRYHAGWSVLIGPRDVYFQQDQPDIAGLSGLASVAGFIIDTVVELLRMPSPRTVGAKFYVGVPSANWEKIARNIAFSTLRTASATIGANNMRYSVGPWQASVTMTESTEALVSLCALDFFCLDSYLIPGEYSTFFGTAWEHCRDDLLPFITSMRHES